jgi:tetratricopeptide (TPR) repeat protein
MKRFPLFFCKFAIAPILLSVLSAEPADESTSKIGGNEYYVQQFPAPDGKVSIDTYTDLEHNDAFVRLVRRRDGHVISSIPFRRQKAVGFTVVWSRDGSWAALSLKSGEAGNVTMRVFKVQPDKLTELKLPDALNIAELLPKDDPARKAPLSFAAVEPVQWLNTTDLLCKVTGSARLFETPVIKPGYLWISYEVTLRCAANSKVAVVKSKQTLYKNGDDEDGTATLGNDAQVTAHHYEIEAASGNPLAQVNLGWLYHEGRGVPRDYKKAVELYTKAAEQGYAPGQAYLASQYATGKGVDKDYNKAVDLFEKAIAQNDPYAFNDFAWFRATCPADSQRNGKQAIEYARKACDLTGWRNRNFLCTLAAAYAEDGDFDRASTYQADAMDLQGDYPDQQEMARALQLYRERKPYSESE